METPLLFGSTSSLLGILSRPERDQQPDFALLMFNSGTLSRVGPHRINVKLARALAVHGVTSLRFDLSGHGDSRSNDDGDGGPTRAGNDIVAAMDHLQRTFGIERYAVLGVCSGAVAAFSAALADRRIVGLMMFDGHWYRSRWTLPVRHWKRLRALSVREITAKLWRLAARRVGATEPVVTPKVLDAQRLPANPPREAFVRLLQSLVDRRVVTHFVYSGTVIDFYSYAKQFRDTFGRERFFSSVRCDFRPDIDHTFVSLAMQHRMIELVDGWVDAAARSSRAVNDDARLRQDPSEPTSRPVADSREKYA